MLILSRYEGESLILKTSDGEIVVSLQQTKGNSAKIGIEAPESVLVLREELLPDADGS